MRAKQLFLRRVPSFKLHSPLCSVYKFARSRVYLYHLETWHRRKGEVRLSKSIHSARTWVPTKLFLKSCFSENGLMMPSIRGALKLNETEPLKLFRFVSQSGVAKTMHSQNAMTSCMLRRRTRYSLPRIGDLSPRAIHSSMKMFSQYCI
jgi:hypothetical protein